MHSVEEPTFVTKNNTGSHRQLYGTQIMHLPREVHLPASAWRAGCNYYHLIPQGKPTAQLPSAVAEPAVLAPRPDRTCIMESLASLTMPGLFVRGWALASPGALHRGRLIQPRRAEDLRPTGEPQPRGGRRGEIVLSCCGFCTALSW